jgi:type IV pilus assembly protein PilW
MKKQLGVTLLELLISMALALSLVAGIGQLFIQSQKSFTFQRNLSDITDDGAFILETISKGLNQAGFSADGSTVFPEDTNVLGSGLDFLNIKCADINSQTPPIGAPYDCEIIKGSDNSLVFRYRLESNELNNFICTNSLNGVQNDVISVLLYRKTDSNGIPVFYCKAKSSSNGTNDAEPLISEVEKLVFQYGVHNMTNDTYYYTNAANITDWKNVFAVKIFIVIRSVDDNLTKEKVKYNIENMEYTATDNRLYRVFSKIVFLRSSKH